MIATAAEPLTGPTSAGSPIPAGPAPAARPTRHCCRCTSKPQRRLRSEISSRLDTAAKRGIINMPNSAPERGQMLTF